MFTVHVNGCPSYITQRLLTRDDLIRIAKFDPTDPHACLLTVRYRPCGRAEWINVDDDTTFKVSQDAEVGVFYQPAVDQHHVVNITVSGLSGSGKTTIMQIISTELLWHGFENVNIDWGADGAPRSNVWDSRNIRKLKSLIDRGTLITLKEVQLARPSNK